MLDIIHDFHPIHNRFHFVLLLLDGGQGWRQNMRRTNGNGRVTLRDYNKYMLHERSYSTNAIIKSAMLMQKFVVMEFAREESQRLRFLYEYQIKLRSEK